jgi:uncharacterized phage-associated protein
MPKTATDASADFKIYKAIMNLSINVAKLIIAGQYENGRLVTNLSLQKLLFYCHAYHLAFTDLPLIDENFEAWTYGPVVPSVYKYYLGYTPIDVEEFDADNIQGLTTKNINIISLVLSKYGDFGAMQLVNMTQQELPWQEHYNSNKKAIIPNDKIRDFYKQFIVKSN